MIDPKAEFRGKRLDAMTVEELREARDLIASNGAWYDSHTLHMRAVAVIDEHIAAAKAKNPPGLSA